jgi:hypothetical protein
MAKSGVTPKEFFAGFGIGEEIKQTNTFLQKLFVQFMKMLRLFYKTLKKYVFNGFIKLWPIYISLFLVAIVVSCFTEKRKRNIFFILYIGALLIIFFIFLLAIRLFEVLIKLIVMLVKGIKSVVKNFIKKKYFDAVIDWLWCSILILFIIVVALVILVLCIIIKNFNYIITSIFDLIENMDTLF